MKKITRLWITSKVPLFFASLATNIKSVFHIFDERYPLYKKNTIQNQPTFILASGRSGNTLLRSMLVSSNTIAIPPESYVIPKVIRVYKANNYKSWNELCDMVVDLFESYKEFYTWETSIEDARQKAKELKGDYRNLACIIDCIYKSYANKVGCTTNRWGDKTPINSIYSDWLVSLFPDAYFIHLIRDPRAVASSYVKAGLYTEVKSSALFWKIANNKIIKALKNKKHLKITYEKLVSEPTVTLNEVTQYLNITTQNDLLDFHKKSEALGDVAVHKHHANTLKPLTKEFINSWENELNEKELNQIKKIVGKVGSYHL